MPQATDNKGSPGNGSETTPLEAYYTQPELWNLERYEGSADQRLRARVVAAMVDPQAETVLDVGCGNGFVTRRLRASKLVVGLDPSEEALSHYDGVRVLASGGRLPFADRSFDAVVCVEVLEHLSDELFRKVTNELARVARNSIVIGVPYRQDLRQGMTRCAECGCVYHVDLHRRSFKKPADIGNLFARFSVAGFSLLGKCEEIRSRTFQDLRRLICGPYALSSFARCPICGASRQHSEKRKTLRFRLFDGLAWRMPKRSRPNWMVVLLRAVEGDSAG